MATWWVSTTGSDSNPGTQALPFATWVHADSVATAGDTVMVQPDGTYTFASTQVTTANGTSNTARVTFISAKLPQKVVVVGTMNDLDLWESKGNYVSIIGFDISGSLCQTGLSIWGHHGGVFHNTFHDLGTALDPSISGAAFFTFTQAQEIGTNEIAYNTVLRAGYQGTGGTQQYHGMYITNQNEFVHHNIISNVGGWGLHILGPGPGGIPPNHMVVANNLIFQCTWGGAQIKSQNATPVDYIYVVNNIICYNGRLGVSGTAIIEQGTTGVNNVYDHNLTYGNLGSSGTNGYSLQNGLVATNQITTQPLFYNYAADGSGNYHALITSPGIAAGTRTLPAWIDASFGWSVDYDGTPLPSSGALDLGPYQASARTTLHAGTYTALTDTFTLAYDLNDFANTWLHTDTLKLQPGKKKAVRSSNIRTDGERVVRWSRPNAHLTCEVYIRDVSPQAALSRAHSLIRAIDQTPYVLRMALPGATSYSYFDVVLCDHSEPTDPKVIQAGAITHISIDFECNPAYRGDRVTLQNLAVNPGFEAPFGGAQNTAAPVAFSDALSNANAYDPQQYANTVAISTPIRWYKMDGVATNVAFDYGSQATNATYLGGVTLGQQPGQQGGSDIAALFDGSTGYVSVPTAGLPTGNSNVTLECWFKISANPAAAARLAHLGNGTTAGQFLALQINTSGQVSATCGSVTTSTSAAVSLNVWHHGVASYDGAKIHAYLDGAEIGTGAAFTTMNLIYGTCSFASIGGSVSFFPGLLDDCAIYNVALTAGTVTSHYNNGAPIAVTLASNLLTIPNGAQVAFGSPAWSALETWQIRFQFATGLTGDFFLHLTDANNRLYVQVAAGVLAIIHTVGGTAHTLTSATPTLTNGTFYWLRVTQFPSVPNDPPYIQATLYNDSAGSVGSQISQISSAAFDAVTALVGRPQIGAVGAALVVGGAFSGVHAMFLFGPGGWFIAQGASATVTSTGGWDTTGGAPSYVPSNLPTPGLVNAANGGNVQVPASSFGMARLDLPAIGTPDVYWTHYNGGTPAGTSAIAVSAGDTLGLTAAVVSNRLSAAATLAFNVNEYDASGSLLRAGTVGTLTGNQQAWTTMYATYTTGASCAYVGVRLRVTDLTAASPSSTIWWDNVQVWNVTKLGVTTMPYCELRFQNSPAQLLVSGLKGDTATRVWLGVGTYLSAWNTGSTLQMQMGRRSAVSSGAQLVGPPNGFYGAGVTPQSIAVLDANSYSGYYTQATVTSSGYNPRAFSPRPQDMQGAFHLVNRFLTQQLLANLANVQTRITIQERTLSWYGNINLSDQLWAYFNSYVGSVIAASNTWTVVDSGQVPQLPHWLAALSDPSQLYLTPRPTWVDNTGGGSTCQAGWQALLPMDNALVGALLYNPSNAPFNVTAQYLWTYGDGLGPQVGLPPAWTYSLETTATPAPGHGGGGAGNSGTGAISVNATAEPYLTLDPTQKLNGTSVNQLVGYVTDNNAAVLPMYCEIQYSPMYLFPR